MNKMIGNLLVCVLCVAVSGVAVAEEKPASAHVVGVVKLIVDDLEVSQTYYERIFGMTEERRYDYVPEIFVESIMRFSEADARLALFEPRAEQPLAKSQFPVVLIYTPEYDATTKRIEQAGYPVRHLTAAEAGPYRIAMTRDPSGNTVEIVSRAGHYEVGGSKLIVNDRPAAETFYQDLLGVASGSRYQTDDYDEVIMSFGSGPFLALFQPEKEEPLPKSRFPVTAIYSSIFDEVVAKLEKDGIEFRAVNTSSPNLRIVIFQDPAGNAIELISR